MGRCIAAAHRRLWFVLIMVVLVGCGAPFTGSADQTSDQTVPAATVDADRTAGESTAAEQTGGPAAPDPATGGEPPPGLPAAASRAMAVSTTSCGHAPATEGSAVAVADRRVLVAAHVVAGATEIRIGRTSEQLAADLGYRPGADLDLTARETWPVAAIVAYDPLRDLALLEVELDRWNVSPEPIRTRVLGTGDGGVIVGAVTSGDVDYTITNKTIIEMDEVRGTRRSQRSGYLIDALTAPGDSGSALYDLDGYLAGVLFAVSIEDGRRSWATAADEIETFLVDESVVGTYTCNPDRSRLERRLTPG